MTWVDGVIGMILILFVLLGFVRGFLRSAFSLIGLALGLALASWNYTALALWMNHLVTNRIIAETIGFIGIVVLVTAVFSLIGILLGKTLDWMGLRWLDHAVGAGFGLMQGGLLVVIGILTLAAFFPSSHVITDARLAKPFLNACQVSTRLGPAGLKKRVLQALQKFQNETPHWLHPSV